MILPASGRRSASCRACHLPRENSAVRQREKEARARKNQNGHNRRFHARMLAAKTRAQKEKGGAWLRCDIAAKS
jgi:hypothetical protein